MCFLGLVHGTLICYVFFVFGDIMLFGIVYSYKYNSLITHVKPVTPSNNVVFRVYWYLFRENLVGYILHTPGTSRLRLKGRHFSLHVRFSSGNFNVAYCVLSSRGMYFELSCFVIGTIWYITFKQLIDLYVCNSKHFQ